MSVHHFLFILWLTIIKVKGEPLLCQDFSVFNEDTQMCQCGEGLFYNAWEGKCQGICSYYGDILCTLFNGTLTMCMQESEDSTTYSCECPVGYEYNEYGHCSDINQCEGSMISCPENEECVELDGEDGCACVENYYRASNGECLEIDLCNQPNIIPCDHICYMGSNNTYSCDCYDGYKLDEDQKTCVVDPDSGYATNCTCDEEHPAWAVCSLDLSTNNQTCEPKPGFTFSYEDPKAQDIDECAEGTDQCMRGYTCTNQNGTYTCECKDGIPDVLGECFGKPCAPGLSLYDGFCKDPCTEEVGFTCPSGFSCFTNEDSLGECRCEISCQMDGSNSSSSYSVYDVSFVLENVLDTDSASFLKYNVMKSMEMLFGLGNSEILTMERNSDTKQAAVTASIGVSSPSEETQLQNIIRDQCYDLTAEGMEGNCLLPNGVLVTSDSISVESFYPCDSYGLTCGEKNAECKDKRGDDAIMPGIYHCVCEAGYRQVTGLDFFYCEDIDECEEDAGLCQELGEICQNTNGNYSCVLCCDAEIAEMQNELDEANYQIESFNMEQESLNQEINDEEKRTSVIAGVLGALMGAAIIAVIVAGVYIFRIRSK